MKDEYPELYERLQNLSAELSRDLRGPMIAYARLNGSSIAPGALTAKVKQLIALGIGITCRCEGCIAYHVHDAIQAGATRQEILETMGISILMGGGPAVIYACEALKALEQFVSVGLEPASPEPEGK